MMVSGWFKNTTDKINEGLNRHWKYSPNLLGFCYDRCIFICTYENRFNFCFLNGIWCFLPSHSSAHLLLCFSDNKMRSLCCSFANLRGDLRRKVCRNKRHRSQLMTMSVRLYTLEKSIWCSTDSNCVFCCSTIWGYTIMKAKKWPLIVLITSSATVIHSPHIIIIKCKYRINPKRISHAFHHLNILFAFCIVQSYLIRIAKAYLLEWTIKAKHERCIENTSKIWFCFPTGSPRLPFVVRHFHAHPVYHYIAFSAFVSLHLVVKDSDSFFFIKQLVESTSVGRYILSVYLMQRYIPKDFCYVIIRRENK